jgi:hypothetical protein
MRERPGNGNGGVPKEREIDVEAISNSKPLKDTPCPEFVPAPEPPVYDLPSSCVLLSHPSAPSKAIQRLVRKHREERQEQERQNREAEIKREAWRRKAARQSRVGEA